MTIRRPISRFRRLILQIKSAITVQRSWITCFKSAFLQNIRSVEELQKVVSYIANNSQQGLTIPDVSQRPGKSLPAGNRTVAGVMNAIGMTLGEQQQFANAMFQLDAARRSSVNQNPTGVYLSRTGEPTKGVQFDAAEAINSSEGSAKVARIPKGSTIRTGTSESRKACASLNCDSTG